MGNDLQSLQLQPCLGWGAIFIFFLERKTRKVNNGKHYTQYITFQETVESSQICKSADSVHQALAVTVTFTWNTSQCIVQDISSSDLEA